MRTAFAKDFFQLTSREVTPEGYLIAPGSLARTGVQEYFAFELGLDAEGVDPMKKIRLHRPAEEVFDSVSMQSFDNKPITIEHPPESVDISNWDKLAKGDVTDIARSGDFMTGKLIVRSQDAIDAIQEGKVQLSNGYQFTIDMTPGETATGEPFDGVQRVIRGNHIALVDNARCGSACRIGDNNPDDGGKSMRTIVVDGIPVQAEDAAAGAIEKLLKERGVIQTALDTANAKINDTVQVGELSIGACDSKAFLEIVAGKDAQIEELKKQVMTPEARDAMVAHWTKLLATANKLAPKVATDGLTCDAIKRAVIEDVCAGDEAKAKLVKIIFRGKDAAEATEEQVDAALETLEDADEEEMERKPNASDSSIGDALLGGDEDLKETKLTGRDAWLDRQQNPDKYKEK
jgi:hypothetical protein